MKRFLVDYKVTHSKEFWVESEKQIHDILNGYNQYEIIRIKELPGDFSIVNNKPDGN